MKDGKEVTVTEWQAENPKALLQISHGMVEHAGRYNEFAEYMAKNGYTVFADDHRAHGETDKDTLGYSDGDIWENTLSDLHELTTYYKNKYNDNFNDYNKTRTTSTSTYHNEFSNNVINSFNKFSFKKKIIILLVFFIIYTIYLFL